MSDQEKDAEWLAAQSQELDARSKRLSKENDDLRKLLGLVSDYSNSAIAAPTWITKPGKKTNSAVAVAQLSDTHFEEVVDPHEMNGLNSYNPDIGEQRLKRWAHLVCEMGHRERFKWSGIILLLSGDIFSGDIHDELRKTNHRRLPEALVHWVPLVAASIGQAVDFYGHAYVDCRVGNHGRLTQKPEYKGRARNNFDWAFYQLVRSHFKNDDRIEWCIGDAPYGFVPLPDDRFICHSHGDEEKGGNSATGGVMYPLGRIRRNGIRRGQTHKKQIAYSACGHWHTTFMAQQFGIVCNGSMKGYDEFAMGHSFDPEPAAQNWWVEAPGKGTVLSAPLYLMDKQKEGW